MSTQLFSLLQRKAVGLAQFSTFSAVINAADAADATDADDADDGQPPTAISNHDGFPAYRYEGLDSDEFGDDDEFEAAERENTVRAEQDVIQAASPGGPR